MTLPPIPDHLPPWQARHLAWLASQGHPTRYAVPDGTEAARFDVRGANLTGADLRGADLRGANLSEAYLSGAELRWAFGIAAIGPMGRNGRMIYAVAHDDGPMVQDGCWWGNVPDTIARIERDYADYADYTAARDRKIAAVRAVAALVMP